MLSSRADPRRSSAEPNVSTLNPSERSRLRIAMRTDSSSSTIPTTRPSTGVASISAATVAPGGPSTYWILVLSDYAVGPADHPPPQRALGSSSSPTTTIRRASVGPFGTIPLRRCGSYPQPICHPHEVGHRGRAHLLHHLPAVDLDGRFAEAEVVCDLLVEQPRDNP